MTDHAGVGYGALGAGLEGRGVIVTGAARGVGAATARAMAAAGARVAALDINAAGLAGLVAGLDGTGHRAITFDLRDVAAIDDLVAGIIEDLGDIWALAHVAALLRRQDVDDVTPEDWDAQNDVNMKATFFLNRAVGNAMIAAGGGGRIINFSSGGWWNGPVFGSDAYLAGKAGVITLSRGFARRFGPHGILVNSIAPGQVDTPMQHDDLPPEIEEASTKACPVGRIGQPEELAAVVVFLASIHAGFVNGATLNVSGGGLIY
ncbi:MAG: SDR family oxidoreductase [bacterium]|nr:SDR family oxidoreductase [bacterium]